jgi:hypothetical protein
MLIIFVKQSTTLVITACTSFWATSKNDIGRGRPSLPLSTVDFSGTRVKLQLWILTLFRIRWRATARAADSREVDASTACRRLLAHPMAAWARKNVVFLQVTLVVGKTGVTLSTHTTKMSRHVQMRSRNLRYFCWHFHQELNTFLSTAPSLQLQTATCMPT